MEETIDYSDLPNYSPAINKVILEEAREALPKSIKENIIVAHEKLKNCLPGGPESFIAAQTEKMEAISDALTTLWKRFQQEIMKKLKQKQELGKQRMREGSVMAELEKMDAVAAVIGALGGKVQDQISRKEEQKRRLSEEKRKKREKEALDPQRMKVKEIAEIFATLRKNVFKEIKKKEKESVAIEPEKLTDSKGEGEKEEENIDGLKGVFDSLEENVSKNIAQKKEEENIDVLKGVFDSLEENVSKNIAQKEQKKINVIQEKAKSIIVSGMEKKRIVNDILNSMQERMDDIESVIYFEEDKMNAVAGALQALGERVEQEILANFGCPHELIYEISEILSFIKAEFDKGVARRSFAFQLNLHETIFDVLTFFSKEIDITYPAFESLISMSKDQPKILNENGISIAMANLQFSCVAATRQQVLRWLQTCMFQSEENRDFLYNKGLPSHLKRLVDDDTTTSPVIHDVCIVLRALCEYENHMLPPKIAMKAQQRIDDIANTFLDALTHFLHKFIENKNLIISVLMTIRKFLVLNYFSELFIYAKKGKTLIYLYDIFISYHESEDLIYELLLLFEAMVGNDIAKSTMMEAGLAYIIKIALDTHSESASITAVAFQCIAKICLMCPHNTRLIIDFGYPLRVVDGMYIHSLDYSIQKLGSWIIRIFCTYENVFVSYLVSLDSKKALEDSIINHIFKCEFDAKAALRDLYEDPDLYEPISKVETDIAFPL